MQTAKFVRPLPASQCVVWSLVASILITKTATSGVNELKLFLLVFSSSNMGMCEVSEVWPENSDFLETLENNETKTRCAKAHTNYFTEFLSCKYFRVLRFIHFVLFLVI